MGAAEAEEVIARAIYDALRELRGPAGMVTGGISENELAHIDGSFSLRAVARKLLKALDHTGVAGIKRREG